MGSVTSDKASNTIANKRSKRFKKNSNTVKSGKGKSVNSKNEARKKRYTRKGRAVIYLGHIPHGFYENEMKSYFNQFGHVLGATVARSKKTGRSRGYGFVEFADEEVAKIAAETMNNYLMFNRVIKCRYIPPEESKGRIYEKKIGQYDYPKQLNRKVNAQNKAKSLTNLSQETYLKKTQDKINEFRKFFAERGINFTFKMKGEDDVGNESTNNENQLENPSKTPEPESEDETDEQFGVLEIDESDDEINFKTPPQVKKVIKKSVSSSVPLNKVSSNNSSPRGGKKKNNAENSNTQKSAGKKNLKKEKAILSLPNIKEKPKTKKKLAAKVKAKKVAALIKQKEPELQKNSTLKSKNTLKRSLQVSSKKELKKSKKVTTKS